MLKAESTSMQSLLFWIRVLRCIFLSIWSNERATLEQKEKWTTFNLSPKLRKKNKKTWKELTKNVNLKQLFVCFIFTLLSPYISLWWVFRFSFSLHLSLFLFRDSLRLYLRFYLASFSPSIRVYDLYTLESRHGENPVLSSLTSASKTPK